MAFIAVAYYDEAWGGAFVEKAVGRKAANRKTLTGIDLPKIARSTVRDASEEARKMGIPFPVRVSNSIIKDVEAVPEALHLFESPSLRFQRVLAHTKLALDQSASSDIVRIPIKFMMGVGKAGPKYAPYRVVAVRKQTEGKTATPVQYIELIKASDKAQ